LVIGIKANVIIFKLSLFNLVLNKGNKCRQIASKSIQSSPEILNIGLIVIFISFSESVLLLKVKNLSRAFLIRSSEISAVIKLEEEVLEVKDLKTDIIMKEVIHVIKVRVEGSIWVDEVNQVSLWVRNRSNEVALLVSLGDVRKIELSILSQFSWNSSC